MEALNTQTTLPQGFVDDGEHPKINLSFVAHVGDRTLQGVSLSVTSAVATGLVSPQMDNVKTPVTLRFDFEGFTVSLFVEAIANKKAAEDPEVVFTFEDPTGPHLAALRYIINSYIAGDILSMSGLLGYNGPVSVKKKSSAEEGAPGLMQRIANLGRRAGVIGLSLGLIYLAGTVVQRHFIYGYDPRPVLVTQDGLTLRATAAGQITFADPNAAKGEVVYSLTSNAGEFLSVKMPCDCDTQVFDDFVEGATVLPGSSLLKLVETGAAATADTEISFESGARVLAGNRTDLVFANGDVLPVTLQLQQDQNDGADAIKTRITFDDPAAAQAHVGEAAQLRFSRVDAAKWISQLQNLAGSGAATLN